MRTYLKYYREFLLAILAYIAIQFILDKPISEQWPEGILEEISEFGLALAFAVCVSLVRVRQEVRVLVDSTRSLDACFREPLRTFFLEYLKEHLAKRREIVDKGVLLSADEVNRFVSVNFELNKGVYQGTDSHVPSSFYTLYPNYLKSQLSQRRTTEDIRILLAPSEELMSDITQHSQDSNNFYTWHSLHGTRLLHVDKTEAMRHAQLQGLPSTDLGIFNRKYVAFYVPPTTANGKYRIFVWSLRDKGQAVRLYLQQLNSSATAISWNGTHLSFTKRDNKEIFEDEKRLLGRERRFRLI